MVMAIAGFSLLSCGDDDGAAVPDPVASESPPGSPPAVTAAIPRLSSGPHWGMIAGFDPLDAARAAKADARFAEAKDAGLTLGRIQIDWSDLETAPGEYDGDMLAEALADPRLDGLNVFVTLSTLDTDGLTLPDYLLSDGELRQGLTMASPEVVDAFTAMLDWLAPQLLAEDVWGLSLGNEVDVPIGDGLVGQEAARQFFVAGMSHWNTTTPDIAVTLTLTPAAIESTPNLVAAARGQSDIVTYNLYCLNPDLTVNDAAGWQADLDAIKTAAGDREVFIQELGCPAGYDGGGGIGGTPATQAQFIDFMGDAFATNPQLRAATVFQLYDWSPELASQFARPLRDADEPVIADRLQEWLTTVGLLRWSDSAPRPGWTGFLAQLQALEAARDGEEE
ncbi:hypothetical protein AAW01_09615 [Aurantiacibacter gangjinensis]|uniref:Uncharacterized protein n=2 Tax=Aurantiacibacter gangjinensis TaxID=502682 RepID=A0A0G9MR14_9SPHN|nr:hypothetical protein AAW01_09615 [Aurantiacibacter gangjinensis]